MNSIINHILISMPHMEDPYFKKSVIYICEHDRNGAMGLIVNKPFSDQIFNEVLYQIGDNSDNLIKSFSNLYFGGPVYIDRGIVLHDKKLVSEKSIKISHDFFISTDKQKLKNLSNINNANYRLFLGHAGWTEGQLENEIANGDWVVQDTSIDFIFNSPEEKMWSTAIESFGIDVSSLSSYSGKA